MENLRVSADSLIAEATEAVKAELLSQLAPITEKIASAVAELEKALCGAEKGKRTGRPKKAVVSKTAPKRSKKRTPRGALLSAVKDTLAGSETPLSLADIRNAILKTSTFKGHDPKTLYTQIAQAVKKIQGVKKSAAKKYTLKAAVAKAPAKKRGRKKAGKKKP